jgi:predicted dehydrogenase
LRTAVIGVGRMGQRHIAAVRMAGSEVVAICDARQDALDAVARDERIEQGFTDPAKMLAEVNPDCVVIATTAPSHAELTCLAAEAGVKFILCEKPMATSLADCDRMIEACAANGVRLAVNHQMRFMPQFTIPKSLGESDLIGGIGSINVVAGNLGLAMHGAHRAEVLRFVTGEHARWVTAWFSPERTPNPRGPEFEDRAGSLRLVTDSGKRLYIEAGADQGHGILSVYAGRRGQVFVDELSGIVETTARRDEDRDAPTSRYGMPAVRDQQTIPPADVVASAAAMLRALFAGDDYTTGEEARRALSVLVAAYVSDESGNVAVDLDRDLPRERKFAWA